MNTVCESVELHCERCGAVVQPEADYIRCTNCGLHHLQLFTVYDHPRDYPGSFVVRRSVIRASGSLVEQQPRAVVPTLADARAAIPPGCIQLARDPKDDPAILEVWL